jgi:hypothetical protein
VYRTEVIKPRIKELPMKHLCLTHSMSLLNLAPFSVVNVITKEPIFTVFREAETY